MGGWAKADRAAPWGCPLEGGMGPGPEHLDSMGSAGVRYGDGQGQPSDPHRGVVRGQLRGMEAQVLPDQTGNQRGRDDQI